MRRAERSVLAGEPALGEEQERRSIVQAGVLDDRLDQLVEQRAEARTGFRAELGDEVVAVDGEIAPVERDLGRELLGHPRPELGQTAGIRVEAAPDVVGPAELEQLVE